MAQRACLFCQRKKKRCNRDHPCDNCLRCDQVCEFPATDERQRRPDSRLVAALKGQIESLEKFISALVAADTWERDVMLSTFHPDNGNPLSRETQDMTSNGNHTCGETSTIRQGRRINVGDASPGIFFGETASEMPYSGHQVPRSLHHSLIDSLMALPLFDPAGASCRNTMLLFFDKMYTSYMYLYREYFLRDYDAGGGPYYSDILMYALCAMGALAGTSGERELSEVFARRCEELLFSGELEHPKFTTLQALLLMGARAIGCGQHGKGWQFTGMAFRMITEMGLYQDPVHWDGQKGSDLQREIFRRVYWAAFVLDKQLSLLYGRPPVIQPQEADVQATIRIPYPDEWRTLLPKYIRPDTTPESYEKGEELVSAFVQKVELCKIIHKMFAQVFSRHKASVDPSILETARNQIHVDLQRWRTDLPVSLRWHKSTKGIVPSYIIELHMLFFTAVMALNKPQIPQSLDSLKLLAGRNESLSTCRQSVEAIISLIKATRRDFKLLPFTFPHTAASAASILIAVQGTGEQEHNYIEWQKLLIDALDGVSSTWASATAVRDAISCPNQQNGTAEPAIQSSDFGNVAYWISNEELDDILMPDFSPLSDHQLAEGSIEQLPAYTNGLFPTVVESAIEAFEPELCSVEDFLRLDDTNSEQ